MRTIFPPRPERLQAVGSPLSLHHGNFAGLPAVLVAEGLASVDLVLADLGMSSMQVDDAERGFSYVRDGPLDMRMDRSRGRTAAQLSGDISEEELAQALRDLGDEPEAERHSRRPCRGPAAAPALTDRRTGSCRHGVCPDGKRTLAAAPRAGSVGTCIQPHGPSRPCVILVNRELANLEQLSPRAAGRAAARRPGGDHQLSQRRGSVGQSRLP